MKSSKGRLPSVSVWLRYLALVAVAAGETKTVNVEPGLAELRVTLSGDVAIAWEARDLWTVLEQAMSNWIADRV